MQVKALKHLETALAWMQREGLAPRGLPASDAEIAALTAGDTADAE